MKRFVSLVLVLILAAAVFTGCGEQKKLLGAWECTVDLSSTVQQLLDQEMLGGEFDVSGFSVTARLTFLEDGTFRLEPDRQKLAAAFDTLLKDLENGLIDMLQAQLKEQGLNISVEELLALSGLELSDLTEQLRQSFEEESFLEDLSGVATLEGFYQVKKDKLLFCADEETKIDDIYTLYTVEDGVLTLSTHVGENTFLGDNLILSTAPVVFTKVP